MKDVFFLRVKTTRVSFLFALLSILWAETTLFAQSENSLRQFCDAMAFKPQTFADMVGLYQSNNQQTHEQFFFHIDGTCEYFEKSLADSGTVAAVILGAKGRYSFLRDTLQIELSDIIIDSTLSATKRREALKGAKAFLDTKTVIFNNSLIKKAEDRVFFLKPTVELLTCEAIQEMGTSMFLQMLRTGEAVNDQVIFPFMVEYQTPDFLRKE